MHIDYNKSLRRWKEVKGRRDPNPITRQDLYGRGRVGNDSLHAWATITECTLSATASDLDYSESVAS